MEWRKNDDKQELTGSYKASFNPCSNGMKKERVSRGPLQRGQLSFNPCSNGMKKEQSCNLMIWETVYSLCLSYITCSQPLIGA